MKRGLRKEQDRLLEDSGVYSLGARGLSDVVVYCKGLSFMSAFSLIARRAKSRVAYRMLGVRRLGVANTMVLGNATTALCRGRHAEYRYMSSHGVDVTEKLYVSSLSAL